jgi:hypothetical protein
VWGGVLSAMAAGVLWCLFLKAHMRELHTYYCNRCNKKFLSWSGRLTIFTKFNPKNTEPDIHTGTKLTGKKQP